MTHTYRYGRILQFRIWMNTVVSFKKNIICLTLILGLTACQTASNFHDKSIDTIHVSTKPQEVAELINLADTGDADAQYRLGLMYYNGKGVPQDYDLAFKWTKLAANYGLPIAQTNIGAMYLFGNGVSKDTDKALDWFLKAANQNEKAALFQLSDMYAEGKDVPKDFGKSIEYLRRSADTGYAKAQSRLGMAMSIGAFGVKHDIVEGVKWMTIAASLGNERSKKALITMSPAWPRSEIDEGYSRAKVWIESHPQSKAKIDTLFKVE